jgi:4-hydroxy-3-polyprenylbenzoate decarboxylase
MKRLIIGMSGASGVIYGIRMLEVLKAIGGVETHLVMSRFARLNIEIETTHTAQEVEALADVCTASATRRHPFQVDLSRLTEW